MSMTSKDKAEELISKFDKMRIANYKSTFPNWSKQCALICVNEILKSEDECDIVWKSDNAFDWNEVKLEIEKL